MAASHRRLTRPLSRRALLAGAAAATLAAPFVHAQPRTIDAARFGARPDSDADNAPALNAAADAVPDSGGTLHLPPGRYRIGTTVLLKSRTTLTGPGATILSDDRWTLPPGGDLAPRFVLVANRNHAAAAPTDHDITVRDIAFAFTGQQRGDAHAVSFRQARRLLVAEAAFAGGGNGTAFLACRATEVASCTARDTLNCAYDHWEGTSDGLVRDNHALCAAGYGILFTGVGTNKDNHQAATNLTATGNRVENPSAAGIWVCSLSEHSSVSNVTIAGNTVLGGPRPANGIGATGAIHGITIRDNQVRDIQGGNPLFARPDKWNRPRDVQIIANQVTDCTPGPRGVALIQALGDNVTVAANRARGGRYRSLVWIDGPGARLADNTGDGLTSRFKYNTASARDPQIADP